MFIFLRCCRCQTPDRWIGRLAHLHELSIPHDDLHSLVDGGDAIVRVQGNKLKIRKEDRCIKVDASSWPEVGHFNAALRRHRRGSRCCTSTGGAEGLIDTEIGVTIVGTIGLHVFIMAKSFEFFNSNGPHRATPSPSLCVLSTRVHSILW